MVGIMSYGGYVPRYRLKRDLIFKAMGWMDRSTFANAKGEKAVANSDEDSITMAVAAGIATLQGQDRANVDGVYFASTTLPYKERLNAGIITLALGMDEQVRAADFTGGLKAGTTALISALESVESGRAKSLIVAAADCRLAKPASAEEMIFGDAGAAFLVGSDQVIAEFKGSNSMTCDFVDHFRGEFAKYDRKWEDRWCRDEGIECFIPQVIQGLLERHNLKITDFKKVIYDCHYSASRKNLNKKLGITPDMEQVNMQTEVGLCGTATPLLMLAGALDTASPGDKLLVVSFGSGCDALYFEVTENIAKRKSSGSVAACLANRMELDNYEKYLVWKDILPAEMGLRGEEDLWTRWSLVWRRRKELTGFWGAKCTECGTVSYPPQRVCPNPQCGAIDKLEEHRFADKGGKIATYTSDTLAASINPPSVYGTVYFDGGGRFFFDFTDCSVDELSVGMPVTLVFRRKYLDKLRGISGYFWKCVPKREVK